MRPVHVKICGLTVEEEAVAAAEAGADAIGVVFAPSPRRVDVAQACAIRSAVPASTELVGVFVEEPFELVREAVLSAELGGVQLHRAPESIWSAGDVRCWVELVQTRGLRIVRALRAGDTESLKHSLATLPPDTNQVLLDAFVPGTEGGTGRTFDWRLVEIVKQAGFDVIVAGGLTPDNVEEAIQLTSPWGVDVSSGVEISPGRKDADAVRRFIQNARTATG